MSAEFTESRIYDGAIFYCPAGHSQVFAERRDLEAELAAVRSELHERDEAYARVSKLREASLAENRRLRQRAKAGLCLLCNRHFTNMERHNRSKHSERKADAEAPN